MTQNMKMLAKAVLGHSCYNKVVATKNHLVAQAKRAAGYMGYPKSLAAIGKICGTDKCDLAHSFDGASYLDIYQSYMAAKEKAVVNLLEIGVKDGQSLKMWKEYFSDGVIHGIDIDPRCKAHADKRIKIEIGSQDDEVFLRKCFGGKTKYDYIIDDGSHVNSMTISAFEVLFYDRLKNGGIYIIEDTACSYSKLDTVERVRENWPGMRYNAIDKPLDNQRNDIDQFILSKVHNLDHRYGNVLFIHMYAMIIVIGKCRQEHGRISQ